MYYFHKKLNKKQKTPQKTIVGGFFRWFFGVLLGGFFYCQPCLHVLLVEAGLEAVEALEEAGQQGQELLIEQVVASPADRTEEGAQEEEIVVGLLGRHGELHAFVHDLMQVRLQHLLVLRGKQRHGAEDELEELEVEVGAVHVGAHFVHALQKVLHQDGGKDGRGDVVGQEAVGHDLEGVILVDALHHIVDSLGEDFLKGERVEQAEHSGEVLQDLLLLFSANRLWKGAFHGKQFLL